MVGEHSITPHKASYDPDFHVKKIPHRGVIKILKKKIYIYMHICMKIMLSSKNMVRIFHCNYRYTHLES